MNNITNHNNTNRPSLENLKHTNTVIKRICNDGLSRTSEIQYNSSNFDWSGSFFRTYPKKTDKSLQTHKIGDRSWTCIMFLIHLSLISSEIIQITCPNLYLIYNFLFVQLLNVNYREIISCSSYYTKWMVSDLIVSTAFHDCMPDFCSCEYANKEFILIWIKIILYSDFTFNLFFLSENSPFYYLWHIRFS